MPIFIAKDYDGRVESIVQADNKLLATTYWQGQSIYPHSVDEIATEIPKDNPYRVRPILKTELKTLRHFGGNEKEYRVISRG